MRLFAITLSLSAHSAYSFAPQALNVHAQPRAAVALSSRPNTRVAQPLRTGAVFATASAPASAAPPSMMSLARSVVLRVAAALMCTLATLLVTATRALAAAATKSAAAAAAGPVITGDMIKVGGLALLCVGVFAGGGKGDTASSGFEYVEEDETGFPDGAGSLEARPVDDEDAETPPSMSFEGVSDSAFSSALSARMQQLASDKPDEEEKPPEPPKDDTGYSGNTGLLERPKPSDVPSVDKGAVDDFPVGFPLRDFEPEDVEPAASADDIAMLSRMFGTPEPPKDD